MMHKNGSFNKATQYASKSYHAAHHLNFCVWLGMVVLLLMPLPSVQAVENNSGQEQLAPVANFQVKQGVLAQVLMSETRLWVQVNNGQQVPVSYVHLPLLREWGNAYLQINDYDHDGMNDVAILKSAGQFGQNRCYAVYRYNPSTGRFRSRKSFDRCGI